MHLCVLNEQPLWKPALGYKTYWSLVQGELRTSTASAALTSCRMNFTTTGKSSSFTEGTMLMAHCRTWGESNRGWLQSHGSQKYRAGALCISGGPWCSLLLRAGISPLTDQTSLSFAKPWGSSDRTQPFPSLMLPLIVHVSAVDPNPFSKCLTWTPRL